MTIRRASSSSTSALRQPNMAGAVDHTAAASISHSGGGSSGNFDLLRRATQAMMSK